MNHTHQTAGHLVKKFLTQDNTSDSILTLGGTGPNGTSQLALLELIGFDSVQAFKAVNLISGSAFGYFIYLAFKEGKMHVENYLNYDKGSRVLHGASLRRGLSFFCGLKAGRRSLYESHKVRETVQYLIDDEFCQRTLSSFDNNMVFWAYCNKNRSLVKITPETFPNMKVWEVITACLSIRFIHGEFSYGDHQFSDPMFSPQFKSLVRQLLRGGENHLFVNYKKTLVSGNVIFIKNQPCRYPNVTLLRDFLTFTFNFKNSRLIATHRQNIALLN